MGGRAGREALVAWLEQAGFVAAEAEADALLAAAGGDGQRLDELLARRLTGEPLAWITGTTTFCGIDLEIHPGLYVPRAHSERLVERAAARLPSTGTAVDVCTGSGAVAAALRAAHPHARVVGTDADPRAVACARANGVEAYLGDLLDAAPAALHGRVDVLVGVVPYVPTSALPLLQRDTLTFEATRSYDGGVDGTDILRRVLAGGPSLLRAGGTVLLELGADQVDALQGDLDRLGYQGVSVVVDEDGDERAIEVRWSGWS